MSKVVSEIDRDQLVQQISDYWQKNKKQLLSTVLKIESDIDLAQDIVSLVAVEALSNLEKFRGDSSIGTYLSSIAHNLAVDSVRKATSRKNSAKVFYLHEISKDADEDSDNPFQEAYSATKATPEKHLESKQILKLVAEYLPTLAKKQPVAFKTWELHRLEGLSYDEIELEHGIPKKLAFLHVFRISESLEDFLKKKVRENQIFTD